MKKIVLTMMVLLGLRGCSDQGPYGFIHDQSEIVQIEFGKVIDAEDEDEEITQAFVVEKKYIGDDVDDVLADFAEMTCQDRGIFFDPGSLYNGTTGVKIIYKNGDFEIINDWGQGIYRNGNYQPSGSYAFDEEEFADFLGHYIDEEDIVPGQLQY